MGQLMGCLELKRKLMGDVVREQHIIFALQYILHSYRFWAQLVVKVFCREFVVLSEFFVTKNFLLIANNSINY